MKLEYFFPRPLVYSNIGVIYCIELFLPLMNDGSLVRIFLYGTEILIAKTYQHVLMCIFHEKLTNAKLLFLNFSYFVLPPTLSLSFPIMTLFPHSFISFFNLKFKIEFICYIPFYHTECVFFLERFRDFQAGQGWI